MQYNAGIIPDAVEPNYTPESKTILDFVNPFADIQPPTVQNYEQQGNAMQNSLSAFANKDASDMARNAPTFFDYDATNADRYTNSDYYKELGFDPYVDNETKYGNRQTWGNTIGNALAGGGKLAWQTFKSGWEGWGNMANALFSWDSSKLAGSAEDLAELYKDQNDAMNKYAIYATPESQNSIFNRQFFGNMLQQGGFAVGATAQFLSEELLTMGLSSGLSAGKFALEGAAYTQRAIKFGEMMKDLKSLGDIWKSENVVKNLVSGARRLLPLAETASDISKAYKAGAGTLQLAFIGAGGVKRALSEANMAFSEARMEAAGTYGDISKRLTDEYIARTGQQPIGDDLDKIRSMSHQAGIENFNINSGILLLSNRLQFENLFNKFGYERRLLKESGDLAEKVFAVSGKIAGEDATRVYEKGILGAAGKYSQIASDFGRRTAAWEATKSVGKGLFHWEATEGIQEVLQDLSNNTMQDYYYNLYHGVKGYTRGQALDRAVELEKSNQGLQTFLMGALTGRLLSPMTFGIQRGVEALRIDAATRQKNDVDRASAVTTLNQFYADPKHFLKSEIAHFKAQDAGAKNMADAVATRDKYVFNNAKDSVFAEAVSAAKKTDMLESLLDTIRNYGDHIKPEEFQEAFGMDPQKDDISNPKTYFNTIANRVEQFSKDYETLHDKYSDLVQPELYKEGSAGHTQALIAKRALDDAIEVLATNRYKSQRAQERGLELLGEIGQNKAIGSSAVSAFNILTSDREVNKNIDMLTEELKGLTADSGIPKDNDTKEQIATKQKQLQALKDWKEHGFEKNEQAEGPKKIQAKDAEKAKDAYQRYINSKNAEGRLDTQVSADDINDTFDSMGDYAELKNDHTDYMNAYNTLANPKAFVMYHGQMAEAIEAIRQRFLQEHLAELDAQLPAAPKVTTTITTTDEEGNEIPVEITEGETYVTKADENNVLFKGKVAKTYNNNIIEIQKIDGDNITIKVNNDKVYTITKDRLANAGKLWNLADMSVDERIYFKNRDMVIGMNVNSKTGKPHLIKGEYANKDYSRNGTKVNARLVLQKEDGVNVLKLQYKNPKTGKVTTVNYSRAYLAKYGDGKLNLRLLPTEADEFARKRDERLKRNYNTQLTVFNERVAEANTQLEQATTNRDQNEQTFQQLRQQLIDDRTELELVADALKDFEGRRGRKSKVRLQLEDSYNKLMQSITDAQAHIDAVKQERDNLDNTIKALKAAQNLYEMAALELMDSETPFDRNGGQDLSSNAQDELDSLNNTQMTQRFDQGEVDQMVEDTQNEITNLNSRIGSLEGYVKDMKDLLSRITDLKDFVDFMDLPQNITNRAGLREFLRKKIAEAPDNDTRDKYQKLMNQVLKGGKDASDILFFLSSMRDSLNELDKLQQQLDENDQKLSRLQTAAQEKRQLSTLADRINFLNQVQQVLTEDQGKVRPADINPSQVKLEDGQEDMISGTPVDSDPNSPTYLDRKPRFEEVGFNKTFGRQFLDENDEKPNTDNGTDRFFAFTAKQNVMGQDYQLQVVTEHNDEFGIRQPEINPNDIKVVLVKKVGDEIKYIDKDGKVIDEPNKDNIIYRSLADMNNLSVERVRNDYTVHESTTDEQIQQKIDEHIAYQKDLIAKSAEGPVYLNAVSTSPGIQRVERLNTVDANGNREIAQAETEGRIIEDNPDWSDLRSANNPEAGIALRVETSKEGGSIAPGVQPGRAVMQEFTYGEDGKKIWGDKVTRVFTRLLNDKEKETVTNALARLGSLFGRKKVTDPKLKLTAEEEVELKLIMEYVKNILCWGEPKNGGNADRFFYISNGLNKGKFKVPLSPMAIRANAAQLLDGVYHHINNKSLKSNEEFTTIKFDGEKAVPAKTYSTYEQYLLEKQTEGVPPVYTSLPRVDSGIPQRTNSYLNWMDPTIEVAKPESSKYVKPASTDASEAPTPETPATQTQTTDQLIDSFANYDTKAIQVNGVVMRYVPEGTGVAIEFQKGNQTKRLPAFENKEQIVRNKENIKKQIYDATGYNPKLGALKALAGPLKGQVVTTAQPEGKAAIGGLNALQAKAQQVQQQAAQTKVEQQQSPISGNALSKLAEKAKQDTFQAPKVEAPKPVTTPSGETQHFTVEEAVEAAQPSKGQLSAKVYEKNIISGETRLAYEATVSIPEGKMSAAKLLLKNALMKQVQTSADEEAPFRLSMDQIEATEDFKALRSFMEANLPQIPVNKVSQLIHGKAWGTFMKGAIYIYDQAEIGTGFHEAFEAVWASYLNDQEQQDLINEFKSRSGEFTNPFTKETKPYAQASDYDAREVMAEEFRRYVLDNNDAPTKKAQGFFEKLWNFIKNLLGLGPKDRQDLHSGINKVFKAIKSGEFRNLNPIRELNKQLPVYRSVGGLTQDETAQAIEGLSYYFFLELYKNGSNVDSLLNRLDPTLSNQLLNKLFNAAHDQVVANAGIIGQRVTQELVNNKKGLYEEFKKSVSRYGLDFNEADDLLVKEETTNNALGIRDTISINPTKMSALNVKLLISSLPDTRFNRSGKQIVQRNNLNQPKLVDYERAHMLLLNELSNVVSTYDADGNQKAALDLMFEKLDKKYQYPISKNYRDGYAWVKNLKLRLKYEDITGAKVPVEALTADDMMLRVGFIKSFTNVKTTPQKTMVGEDGYIYNLNPMENVNMDRVRENWSNNLKNELANKRSGIVELTPSGIMILNRNTQEYRDMIGALDQKSKFDLDKALEVLSKLGIVFSSGKQELNKYDSTIRENTIQILEQIKAGTVNSISDIYGSNIIDGRIDTLLNIESGFTGEDTVLSYRNAEGEAQYAVGIPSLLSNVINTLNSVKSLSELVQSSPWLGTVNESGEVVLNTYQQNSELLKKGGVLFDTKGNRRQGANISYQVITGMGTSDFEGTATDQLQFPERVANKIHYLLNNTVFSNINSDKSTEFGIAIPGKALVSVGDVNKLLFFGESPIVDLYVKQLTDEMKSAVENKKSPSNIQYYKDQVSSLGHFRDILGKELIDKFKKEVVDAGSRYTGDNAHESFINANKAAIDKAINNYLLSKVDQTTEFLKALDIFTKPGVAGNDLYTSNAIDNDALVDILKIQTTQKVTVGVEDGEKVQRQGFTETDVRTLAGYLAFNEESLINEQHKLIYGHPAFYKDLPKRANGATSTKEQMVDDPDTIKWMDNNMARNDGKQRSEESHQTIKVISFADNNVVTPFYKDIAEGMYRDMVKSESDKKKLEKKIGATFDDKGNLTGFTADKKGFIKAYLELNEADAMAWGMPDAIRDMLFLTGKLNKEQQGQFDYEIAYENLALYNRGDAKLSDKELQAARAIVAKGNPGYIFPVLKPQYFGYAQDSGIMHPVFLKHAVQPKFFRHVEGTQFEKLYLAAKKNQVDIIGFESGEKVGNVLNKQGKFTSIYNDNGEVNVTSNKKGYDLPSDLPQQKLFSRFYGIQVETAPKAKTEVVRGTQVSKLIMVNYFDNGSPISEKIGGIIQEYNNTLIKMMQFGKQNLLKELGLVETEDGYQTSDLKSLVKTLRRESETRGMPDNMIEGIDAILNEDDTYSLKYKFDTLINREKIDNILNSIIDSRVISEKINGKAAVQVASTLYESAPRNFMYLKDGVYTQLSKKDLKALTPEQKSSIRMQSSDLKFYRNENGKIQSMEVYVTWPYKNFSPEDMGLTLENGIYKLSGNHKLDNRLLTSLGFRIPTQAMNSIESLKIKGFTPVNNGDMIVVPSEIVGKSGSDFDIDKLNIYLANHFYNSTTKELQFAEWKGSEEATRDFFTNLYNTGQLLDAEQAQELDRYIAEEQSLLDDEPEDKLLKAIFQNLFTEEQLTAEFMADMANHTTRRNRIVDELTKKALQNHFITVMNSLVQEPVNYRQLVMPNGVDTIKTLADEITRLKIEAGTRTKEDEKSFAFLRSFVGNNQIRERYLTAKRMVGIAALHSTFHSLAQVAGLKLSGDFLTKGIYYLAAPQEKTRSINIKLRHNPKLESGEYNIGHRNDATGNLISELMSEKLSGFVDGAKDPFVFDLNLNMNTASTWFYGDHHGVPQEDMAYFFGQPILDHYFDELAKNRAGFKKINGENLNNEALFYKVAAPYFKQITGRDINKEISDLQRLPRVVKKMKANFIQELNTINNEFEQFSISQMREAIRLGEKADPKLQLAVLMNYLEYSTQGRLMSNFMQAIGYDNRKTKTVQENMIQVARWERSKTEKFISNPDSIMDSTFLGEMKRQKEDIFSMFKDFFETLSPAVQKVFQPMEKKINNPDFFATQDDQINMLNRYQNFVVAYLLHTTKFENGTGIEVALNEMYNDFFRGNNSMAKVLQRYKNSADPFISENEVIKELLPLMNEDTTKTDNISLFRNKIDTFKTNSLIEALDNLKSYGEQTADDDLVNFVDNLAKFSIMQSGLQNSSIDFKKVMSTGVYSELVKTILDKFNTSQDLDPEHVWKSFHQNNWRNNSIVPKAPTWLKVKENKLVVGMNSAIAANDFIIKYAKKPGISRQDLNQMRKDKTFFNAFQPVLFQKMYATENGKFVYEPINKLGDGYRMIEIYSDDRASILTHNGDISTDFVATPGSSAASGWISYADLMNNKLELPENEQENDDINSELTAEQKEAAMQKLKEQGTIQRDC